LRNDAEGRRRLRFLVLGRRHGGPLCCSALLQKIKTGTLLAVFAATACLLVVTSMLTIGPVAIWSILAVGLFNSIMFPSIFTLGIEGLGPLTGKGSGC